MAFVYKRRTILDIRLRLLDYAIQAETYEAVLDALGAGIRSSAKRIERTEDAEGVAEYEVEIIENMLGAAYVVCQAQITAVAQAAGTIPNQAVPDHELRALGPRFNTGLSKIQVLWALANYFKHRDEWSSDTWLNPPRNSRATVEAIKAAGLRDGSTGNLRTGAEALGNASYDEMAVFSQLIRTWSADVRQYVVAAEGTGDPSPVAR